MHRGAFLAAGLSLALGACAHAKPHDHLAWRVDRVSASVEGDKLVVAANGAVASGGWRHPRLRVKPHERDAPIVAMEFLVDPPPPKRVFVQVLLPVAAQLQMRLTGRQAVAVSVVSQTNEITTQIRR